MFDWPRRGRNQSKMESFPIFSGIMILIRLDVETCVCSILGCTVLFVCAVGATKFLHAFAIKKSKKCIENLAGT